jgi:hypothetical protein
LCLRAAAAGTPIKKLALQEPPFVVDPADRRPPDDLRTKVCELIAADQRGAAVKYFMTVGMGAPAFVIPMIKAMPGAWAKLTAVAHTLPYDTLLCENYQRGRPLPAGEWDSVTMPTLVMTGTERESPAFLGHAKKLTPKVISATLTEFFSD